MTYHNFWTFISENGSKYKLQVNDDKRFVVICDFEGPENKIELTGDSYEETAISGLNKIEEINNKEIFEEILRIAMKYLYEYLKHYKSPENNIIFM